MSEPALYRLLAFHVPSVIERERDMDSFLYFAGYFLEHELHFGFQKS
jgi:hypothetical protein